MVGFAPEPIGIHEYVTAPTAPVGVTRILPLQAALHFGFVPLEVSDIEDAGETVNPF